MNDPKLYIYALIAVINQLSTQQTVPATSWDWFKYVLGAFGAGLVAAKAYWASPTTA